MTRTRQLRESGSAVAEPPAAAAVEVSPPGWEGSINGMKDHPEISNPWALAWWMNDNGYTSHEAADPTKLVAAAQKFKSATNYESYCEKYPAPAAEANVSSAAGQLTRYRKPTQESRREAIKGYLPVHFMESVAPNQVAREMPVILIQEGMGNPEDRHVYTKEALQQSVALFEGSKMGADHPSKSQQVDRPEGSIRDIVGYYKNLKYVEVGGRGQIQAIAKVGDGAAFDWAWDLLTEAVAYQKQFPGKTLVGFSISAGGVTHSEEWTDGQPANIVDQITHVSRVDIVTQPGAGGQPLSESNKPPLKEGESTSGGSNMKDLMQKHLDGLKGVRDKMKKDPEHEKAYGSGMDEAMALGNQILGAMGGAGAAAEPEAEPAAEGTSANKAPMAAAESEDGAYAKEAARYQAGKMTSGEKVLFEALSKSRAKAQMQEAEVAKGKNEAMIDKKLKESGLPEKTQADLRLILKGHDDAFVEATINDRKNLLESITGNRATGTGAAGGNEPSASALQERVKSSGLPLREVK